MPPVLSSWAAVFAAQELMYRCEQHLSESGFLFLMIVQQCRNNDSLSHSLLPMRRCTAEKI